MQPHWTYLTPAQIPLNSTIVQSVKCDICGKTLKNQMSLNCHIRLMHQKPRFYLGHKINFEFFLPFYLIFWSKNKDIKLNFSTSVCRDFYKNSKYLYIVTLIIKTKTLKIFGIYQGIYQEFTKQNFNISHWLIVSLSIDWFIMNKF